MRRIVVYTGNRSEYGILRPVIDLLCRTHGVECHVIVSGAHLINRFGKTKQETCFPKLAVVHEVPISLDNHSLLKFTHHFSESIAAYATALDQIKADIVLIHGDRTESFAALLAAVHLNLFVAHIEGGDVTAGGTLDDNVRHAMSKLAHQHFVTNSEAASRLLQMGETKEKIMFCGSLIGQLVKDKNFALPEQVMAQYKLNKNQRLILFTQHASINSFYSTKEEIHISLQSLRLLKKKGYQLVLTYANSDIGGDEINTALQEFSDEFSDVILVPSLGWFNFHGILNYIENFSGGCVLGNSSAGLKEAIFHNCPVVNVGDRQKGRLSPENVVHVDYNVGRIIEAVELCQTKAEKATWYNPYDNGDAAQKIVEVLANIALTREAYIKSFNELGVECL